MGGACIILHAVFLAVKMVSAREAVTRLFLMVVHVYVVYKDYITMYNCPDVEKYYFTDQFFGRLKFFTFITSWVNVIYYVASFLVEVLSLGSLRLYADYVFTTGSWGMSCVNCVWVESLLPLCNNGNKFPTAICFCSLDLTYSQPLPHAVTVLFFWGLYALDRDNIYPEFMDEYIPAHGFMNHAWHTLPLVASIIECVTLPHYHPPIPVVIGMLFGVSITYISWMVFNYYYTGIWIYPFLEKLTPVMFVAFCIVSVAIFGSFYAIGRGIGGTAGQIRLSPKRKAN